jgi:polygalacturonase
MFESAQGEVTVYPAPEGEPLNAKFNVKVDGMDVPVYNAKIGKEDKVGREKAMDVRLESHLYYDIAGIAYFDLKKGSAKITVSVEDPITKVKILPTSFGIKPTIAAKTVSFEVDKPQHVTVEINGDHIRSLHIFVNPEEKDVPDPNDPNVVYFGPGIHTITSKHIGDNKTVYIAGGAVVRAGVGEDEESWPARWAPAAGLRNWRDASFNLRGKNITFRGRGIFDQEGVPNQGRQMMRATVDGLNMEGVIFRNSSSWTVSLRDCNNVHIDNIKILGFRANSDGIDINSSIDVLVENCFLRTLDDLVVVKTLKGSKQDAERIRVRKCVLWNEVAHALSIGAELTRKVEDVIFEDCDVIGDHGREWTLRIYHTDSALIKNVRFENIRIEESVKFASLWINKAVWTSDAQRGRIEDVVFKDITVNNSGRPLRAGMEFVGYDEEHQVKNVVIDNVVINGKKVVREDVKTNEFVEGVTVK